MVSEGPWRGKGSRGSSAILAHSNPSCNGNYYGRRVPRSTQRYDRHRFNLENNAIRSLHYEEEGPAFTAVRVL